LSTAGQGEDGADQPGHAHQAVGMDFERPQVEAARHGAGIEALTEAQSAARLALGKIKMNLILI
jgi:hypothetical protein